MSAWTDIETTDSGQLALGIVGEQRSLLPLPDPPAHPDPLPRLELILANGDRAEALNESGLVAAARTLLGEAGHGYSADRLFRQSAIVTKDGVYCGPLTNRVREGRVY